MNGFVEFPRNAYKRKHIYLPFSPYLSGSIELHYMRSQITMEYNDAVPAHDLSLYVSLSLLSTMAIGLRLISRIKTKNALKGDDWWAFLSLILLQTFLGLSIWGTSLFLWPSLYLSHLPLAMKKMKNIKNDESLAMFPENFNKVWLSTTHSSPSQRLTPLYSGYVCHWTDFRFYDHSSED